MQQAIEHAGSFGRACIHETNRKKEKERSRVHASDPEDRQTDRQLIVGVRQEGARLYITSP